MISSLANAPSRPVIIQFTGKELTNLHKFLARAAVPFLFRSSLPLFRHDPSIFEFFNETYTGWVALVFKFVIDIIDLIWKIFIFTVCYAVRFGSTDSLSQFDASALLRLSLSFCLCFWCNLLLQTLEYLLRKFQICHYNYIKLFDDFLLVFSKINIINLGKNKHLFCK